MIWFIIGVLVGAGAALMIIGFLAVVAEDEENKPVPPEHLAWYLEDDGK